MDADPVAQVREQIDERWETLHAAISRLSHDQIERSRPDGWSAKESIAHLAFWDEAAFGFMLFTYYNEPLPEGWTFGSGWLPGDEPWPHFEVHNAREAAWARERTPDEVLRRLASAHGQLLAILPRLTPALVAEKRDHLNEISAHYLHHLAEIQAAAETKEPA